MIHSRVHTTALSLWSPTAVAIASRRRTDARPFTGTVEDCSSVRPLFAVTRQQDLLTLKDLAETGAITPVVHRAYPLAEAADAVRHLEKGHPRGKLVVTI